MHTTLWLAPMLLGTVLLFPAAADQNSFSNGSESAFPVSVHLRSADPSEYASLRIQVVEMGSRRIVLEMPVGGNGVSTLPSLRPGFYELRIVDSSESVRAAQDFNPSTTSSLNLALPTVKRQSGSNTVSALRLMHETPRKAQKEIGIAAKALEHGDKWKAIEHLEKAFRLDLDNFTAASNLGALYLQVRRPEKALEYLEKAYEIDPSDAVNNINLSAYHANEGDFAKAERFASESLKVDPNSVKGHYMLAVALVNQGKNVDHARSHLAEIQNQFAPAKNLLMSLRPH